VWDSPARNSSTQLCSRSTRSTNSVLPAETVLQGQALVRERRPLCDIDAALALKRAPVCDKAGGETAKRASHTPPGH
jgi:hypothetical protein